MEDLPQGSLVSGPVGAGGVGRQLPDPALPRNAVEGLGELFHQCRAINDAAIARARPCPHAEAALQKHLQEVASGKVGPSLALSDVD
eukprot:355783-Pyramimonas_sp.AAC.1